MYKEKLNSMENCIPTAVHSKKHSDLNYPISFDKTFLSKVTVIGQVDKKFIAALEETKHLLVLFDQHAVHERIRLEELLEGIFFFDRKFCIQFVLWVTLRNLRNINCDFL